MFNRTQHFARCFCRALLQLFVFLASTFVLSPLSHAASTCTHYASPTGTGNGSSVSQPFKISNFWSVASPGKTLCLLDGTYTGNDSMITPPNGLSGTANAPITIKAINDGRPWIYGQRLRNPFILKNNGFFVIEGLDVSDSSGTTIVVDTADNTVIRRVCAWNATSSNNIWTITGSRNALLEDVCGFGTGIKTFSNVGGGNAPLTIRRAWGRWEQSNSVGPKITFANTYAVRGAIYENLMGTWDATAMGQAVVNQPYGIFATEGLPQSNQCAEAKFLGSIAYFRSLDVTNNFIGGGFFGSRSTDCVLVKDLVINIEGNPNLRPMQAQKFDGVYKTEKTILNAPVGDRQFINVTEIGGGIPFVNTDPVNGWNKINYVDVASVAAAKSAGANPFQSGFGTGARVCRRYVDGVLTTQPLWPWPMDDRINAALSRAGRNPSNYFRGAGSTLTSEIETQFGSMPAACKSTSPVPAAPLAAPTMLVITREP